MPESDGLFIPGDLDELYGLPRSAESTNDWETGHEPLSLCFFDAGVGKAMAEFRELALAQPFRAAAQTLNFIWGMGEDGKIRIAIEEIAQINERPVPRGIPIRRGMDPMLSSEKKLGHPCIVAHGTARIAGELYLDESTDVENELAWTLNARSGRFHGSEDRRPKIEQIRNVARIFARNMNCRISLDLIDDMRSPLPNGNAAR
ncbi:MAG: hypothetical protein KF887_15205 [Paracoccaceae bacterium]|nr:MAG: hypothetical protein KF887_15205 [Paracoccaceae bacterium]